MISQEVEQVKNPQGTPHEAQATLNKLAHLLALRELGQPSSTLTGLRMPSEYLSEYPVRWPG